jgi:hypothetical protein
VVADRPGKTKNKKARVLPLEGELWRIIKRQYENRPSDCPWVFYRADGRRIITFRKAWKTACKAAGYPNMLFHDFRRTAAQVFRRYSIVSEDDLRDVVWRGQAFAAAEREVARGSECGKSVANDVETPTQVESFAVANSNEVK